MTMLEFFGLSEEPFGVTPDHRFLYLSSAHKEAAASLYRSIIDNRGIAAMVAPAGMGKSTLLRFLEARIRPEADVFVLSRPFSESHELLRWILLLLGQEPDQGGQLLGWQRLHQVLGARHEQGRKIVLMIDEAQSLGTTALEAVCHLSNLETTRAKLVHIVLSGQPRLMEKLREPELASLRQRTSLTARIEPLPVSDVGHYIRHRLRVAGRAAPLFSPEGISAVARHTCGVPRMINSLCYHALALAWARNRSLVDDGLADEAARELVWEPEMERVQAACPPLPRAETRVLEDTGNLTSVTQCPPKLADGGSTDQRRKILTMVREAREILGALELRGAA